MYVCLCKAVTDSQIKSAAEQSNGCFRSVRESLGVGTVCGSCACEAKKLVKASARKQLSDNSLFYQPA
ncbi:(2Fe-2S)-binding protein [Agaribacterium haliotis]|uniref:(2Fe-2S)-binding protein n=1 Tax=Agaribacterium haliotis TaxID=2013869 RepID=UPI000BB53E05|nr:(2Fe-2S)-binding protein [Agaribacterium haliotis]